MIAFQDLIISALARGYQIGPDALKILEDSQSTNYDEVISLIIEKKRTSAPGDFVINKSDLIGMVYSPVEAIEETNAVTTVESIEETNAVTTVEPDQGFEIIRDVVEEGMALEGIDGYWTLFKSRFEKFKKIARERTDSFQVTSMQKSAVQSINKISKIAGLLTCRRGERGRVQITVENEGGSVNAVAFNESVRRRALESLLDQMVLVELERSKSGRNVVKDLRPLDVPDRSINSSGKVVYGVFLSDIHVGSKTFLRNSFEKFLSWLSDRSGEDSEIVNRIKYLVIAGDVVDGVGVYPAQENELEEKNIVKQYEMFFSLIDKVPKNIHIFVTPGNHDATRQALPQFAIPKKYAGALYEMENLTMLGNPAEIRLHGVNVLIYHGQSLPDVVSTAPNQSFERPAAAMKLLLKARHLAPTYGRGTSFAPEKSDRLVIESVPDIFHCGHIHTLDSDVYKGTLLLNSGTWQSQTRYQYNMGIVPVAGVAPIVNLSTFDVLTKNFL